MNEKRDLPEITDRDLCELFIDQCALFDPSHVKNIMSRLDRERANFRQIYDIMESIGFDSMYDHFLDYTEFDDLSIDIEHVCYNAVELLMKKL